MWLHCTVKSRAWKRSWTQNEGEEVNTDSFSLYFLSYKSNTTFPSRLSESCGLRSPAEHHCCIKSVMCIFESHLFTYTSQSVPSWPLLRCIPAFWGRYVVVVSEAQTLLNTFFFPWNVEMSLSGCADPVINLPNECLHTLLFFSREQKKWMQTEERHWQVRKRER